MKFSIVISAHPDSATAHAAFNFCQAIIKQRFEIERIFYLGQGTLNGSHIYSLNKLWRNIIKQHAIDAACCAASAVQNQLADASGKATSQLSESFHIAGLGQLIEMQSTADRIVTFGQR